MNLKKRNEILFTFQFNTEYLNPIYIYLNCIKKLKIIFLPKQQKRKRKKNVQYI